LFTFFWKILNCFHRLHQIEEANIILNYFHRLHQIEEANITKFEEFNLDTNIYFTLYKWLKLLDWCNTPVTPNL
jgi:hypothetical protein